MTVPEVPSVKTRVMTVSMNGYMVYERTVSMSVMTVLEDARGRGRGRRGHLHVGGGGGRSMVIRSLVGSCCPVALTGSYLA